MTLRRQLRLGLLVALVASLGCAGSATAPADDEPEPVDLANWRRADHQGLVIYTSAPDGTAERAFRQLQRFTNSVSLLVSGQPFVASRRIEVFVFGSESEYRRFAPRYVAGHALRSDDENHIALSLERMFEGRDTLFHELVHMVLHNDTSRRFPSWLHEGLAMFFGTSVLRGDVLTIGGLSPQSIEQIRAKRALPPRRLFGSPAFAQKDIGLFYADAWAFVHYGLLSTWLDGPDRRREFGAFVDRVSRGESWETALPAAFGATVPEVTDEYEHHRKQLAEATVRRLSNLTVDIDEPALQFTPVEPLAIALELGELGLDDFGEGIESAAWLYDTVLEANPDSLDAVCGRIRVAAEREEFELGESLWGGLDEQARSTTRARHAHADLALLRAADLPDDERQSQGAEDLEQAVTGFSEVLADDPHSFSAQVGLGRALVLSQDADPAPGIAALEQAAAMAPDDAAVRLYLAELLIRSGETATAEHHLNYVVEAYPGSEFARRAQKLRRKSR